MTTMTDVQQEALAALSEVWALSPDIRLGQLMAHLGFLGEAHLGKGLGDIEDDEILATMYRHKAELMTRLQGGAEQPLPPTDVTTSLSGSPTLPASHAEANR